MIQLLASPGALAYCRTLEAPLLANGLRLQPAADPAGTVATEAQCQLLTATEFLDPGQSFSVVPIIVLADSPGIAEAVRCIKAGATDYLAVPLVIDELLAASERAVAEQHLQPPARAADQIAVEIRGDCQAMQDLRARIHQLAGTDSPVLILGEVGSGKELVARALHRQSVRRNAPLLSLSCSSLPPNLVEAELFGTASHDAPATLRGLVRAAHKGTLLLEDIGELTDTAQARLLDLLVTGSLRPPGATERIRLDVRLIATASQPLTPLVASGRVRADLEHRIAAQTLRVPPLRDRGGDVTQLATEIFENVQHRLGRQDLVLPADSLRCIEQYHWPGNVRELENAMERAILLSQSGTISPTDLGIQATLHRPAIASPAADEAADTSSLEDYFVNFVLEHQDALTETELAERLGISRKSLWERRQRLNIPRTRTRKRGRRRDSA